MGQKPLPTPKKTLKITSEDEGADVTVLDGRLRPVANGRGAFEAELPPGVYKVVARLADARHEELAVLGAEAKSVRIPRLAFTSPVPLLGTARVHEDVIRATVEGSDRGPIPVGPGDFTASLFLVISESADVEGKQSNPARLGRDVYLDAADGEELYQFAKYVPPDVAAPCLTAKFRLAPGNYRLRIGLPSGDSLQQAIVTLAGWQTQVFLRRRQFQPSAGPTDGLRPDLPNAAIGMFEEKNGRFDPKSEDWRLSELARLSLANRRPTLADPALLRRTTLPDSALHRIARGDTPDLMLRLHGLHSLLAVHAALPREPRRKAVDADLRRLDGKGATLSLSTCITNLREKLSPQVHPDVEALALLIEEPSPLRRAWRSPPMLRDSWVLVCEATAKDSDIVPRGSVSSKVALSVVNRQPWLQWMTPGRNAEKRMIGQAESYRELLEEILPKLESDKIPPSMRRRESDPGPFPDAMGHVSANFSAYYMSEVVSREQRERLVLTLGLPSSSVEALLDDLIFRAHQDPTPRQYAASLSLEAEQVLGDPVVELEPARDGVVHLPPGQKFGVRFRSRKTGVVTVAVLGPEGGIILPRGTEQFAVKANKESTYPSLQGPNKEKARLLITVTAKPLAEQLRKEITNSNVYLDEAKLYERVNRAVRATDQEWSIISTATLVPDQEKR